MYVTSYYKTRRINTLITGTY